MTEQKDYGGSGDDIALVPGALTAYRHFALRPDGMLGPMNGAARDVYPPSFRHEGVFHAACHRTGCGVPGWVIGASSEAAFTGHEPPQIDCTCGFYAHYDPAEDFYSQATWTAEASTYQYAIGGYHAFTGQNHPRQTTGYGMVRAVVELSGRIVMGSKGVRAQKLKVKALAVDWGKFDTAPFDEWDDYADEWDDYAIAVSWVDGAYVTRPRTRGPAQRVKSLYEAMTSTAAASLGAEYFTDPSVMYEKYPKPDLSSLGITPAVKPPKAWGGIDAVFRLTAADVEKISQSLGLPNKKTPQGVVPDSRLARVIEARKNRPAPPGTGIDRRKRKL